MNIISEPISKVVVAITGASGSMYGASLIKQLLAVESITQIAVVFSDNGKSVWDFENAGSIPESGKIMFYENHDLFVALASGSAGFNVMFVAPCSMGSLAGIATGHSNNLILRAADVMLKERKPLVLMVREAPYSLVHLENMTRATQAGAIVFPASPFYYHHPENIQQLISPLVSRMLSVAGIAQPEVEWGQL